MAARKKISYSESEIIKIIVNRITSEDQKNKQSWEQHNFFRYLVDTDNESSGCTGCGDDYCRCSTIVSTKVNLVNLQEMVKKLTKESLFPIINYCVDRILRNHELYKTENFEVNIVPGYYGEETDGVYFTDPNLLNKISEDIQALDGLSDIDKIKHVLKGEYGYLLPKVENCSTISVQTIDPQKIIFPQGFYQKKIKAKDIDYYSDHNLPRAIVDSHYQIIDGYHRTTSALQNNLSKIEVIIIQ